jgi:ATP-dependent Zn protease
MKEPIIKLTLKDYEELKQFKDNAFKKNFVGYSKGCFLNDYTNFHFYTDEDMHIELKNVIELLKNENTDLKNENADLKNDLQNQIIEKQTLKKEHYFNNIDLKKMNIFEFIKWKKNN